MADIARKMQDEFRHAYKGKCRREFDMYGDSWGDWFDPDCTLGQFEAYRGIHGGMVVCHLIPNARRIVWFFTRAKATPIPLVVWAGQVTTMEFPKGCLDPRMIKLQPNTMQRRFMQRPQWQPLRVKRKPAFV